MATSKTQTLTTNSPRKDIFALRFLHSLLKLRSQKSFFGPNKTSKRARKIKIAAYVCMARSTGGTHWRWSRAILGRVNRRAKANKILGYIKPKKKSLGAHVIKGRIRQRRRDAVADRLGTVVPGGGGMEPLRLMMETAHYIKCLSMQVNVMQSIVDALAA